MKVIHVVPMPPAHPDYQVVAKIEAALVAQAKGLERLKTDVPRLIRRAIDEVIDAPRTGRVYARELEKTEKTYIGTKVEILVRNYFRLPKGILDLKIAGMDVDVKNTLGKTWMIPREALGKPCIVVASDETRHLCYFGILVAHLANLTSKENQDKKRSVSSAGFANIHWIFANEPYPPSFWSVAGEKTTQTIMRGKTGSERVRALFREIQKRPISRDIVQEVAQQKDYMKRLRKNGGARDALAKEGIALLSGKYDSVIINCLGLESVGRDEFISIEPILHEDISLLKKRKKIA